MSNVSGPFGTMSILVCFVIANYPLGWMLYSSSMSSICTVGWLLLWNFLVIDNWQYSTIISNRTRNMMVIWLGQMCTTRYVRCWISSKAAECTIAMDRKWVRLHYPLFKVSLDEGVFVFQTNDRICEMLSIRERKSKYRVMTS